jgi:hypothetical protein
MMATPPEMNPSTASQGDSDLHLLPECSRPIVEPSESVDSWDHIFEEDFDSPAEPNFHSEVPSLAVLERPPEAKRAKIETTSTSSGTVSSNTGYDAQAWEALLRDSLTSRLKSRAKPPWETGYMAQIFNKSFQPSWLKPLYETPSYGLPELPANTSPVATASLGLDDQRAISRGALLEKPGVWPVVAHRVAHVSFWDKDEATRNRALQWMKLILLENLECSALGRTLVSDVLAFQSESVLVQTIQDIFASRATATLKKRA